MYHSRGAAVAGKAGELVGQVARREEPLNLDHAEKHPNFLLLPGIGEEQYHSFLGAPIIHQREVLGVLVVQQKDSRRFDEEEEAFLVTMSAQLAGVLAHARATGSISKTQDSVTASALFKGIAGAPGVAIGRAVVIVPSAELHSVPQRRGEDADIGGRLEVQGILRGRMAGTGDSNEHARRSM